MNNPNSFDQEIKDATANPETPTQRTETETTVNPNHEATHDIDYRTKFSESAKEAIRLKKENDELLARLAESGTPQHVETPTDNLYPGYEQLDEEAQRNLQSFRSTIREDVKREFYKDPAIAYAKQTYNEKKWNEAFDKAVAQNPELSSIKDEFKSKYFQPNNVPENIEKILNDVAKIELWDKAKEIGAVEERKRSERIDSERATGGDKTPQATRSLEDWNRMAQENPAKFALLSKEYHNDLQSGKF